MKPGRYVVDSSLLRTWKSMSSELQQSFGRASKSPLQRRVLYGTCTTSFDHLEIDPGVWLYFQGPFSKVHFPKSLEHQAQCNFGSTFAISNNELEASRWAFEYTRE